MGHWMKLTNQQGWPLAVNPHDVVAFHPDGPAQRSTALVLSSGQRFFVKETFDEVSKLLAQLGRIDPPFISPPAPALTPDALSQPFEASDA